MGNRVAVTLKWMKHCFVPPQAVRHQCQDEVQFFCKFPQVFPFKLAPNIWRTEHPYVCLEGVLFLLSYKTTAVNYGDGGSLWVCLAALATLGQATFKLFQYMWKMFFWHSNKLKLFSKNDSRTRLYGYFMFLNQTLCKTLMFDASFMKTENHHNLAGRIVHRTLSDDPCEVLHTPKKKVIAVIANVAAFGLCGSSQT